MLVKEPIETVISVHQTTETIPDLVRKILVQLGEDPNREGLRHTPERFAKALQFLTSGYRQDPEKTVQRSSVQRLLRPDGRRERHRSLQHVRTSSCCRSSASATWPTFRRRK